MEDRPSTGSVESRGDWAYGRDPDLLQQRVAALEQQLAQYRAVPDHQQSHEEPHVQISPYDELGSSLEQLNLGLDDGGLASGLRTEMLEPLLQLAAEPRLPSRATSTQIVNFALNHLGWIHCAVRADVFLSEHESFWDSLEAGQAIVPAQRSFTAIYCATLCVCHDLEKISNIQAAKNLPRLGSTSWTSTTAH